MRVALLSPGWPPSAFANGIVTYVELLQKGFEAIGVDSLVLAASVKGIESGGDVIDLSQCRPRFPLVDKIEYRLLARFKPHEIVTRRVAASVTNGLRHVDRTRTPDLLEMEESFGSADHVASRARIPVVVRLHGPWFLNGAAVGVPRDEAFRSRVALEGHAIANAKAITSPSRDLLDRVRREYQLELPDCEVIPNPAPEVDEGKRWTLAGSDPNTVLFVGRFDRHKGGDLVIDAFAALAADRPGLELVFIGPDRGLEDGRGSSMGLQEYLSQRVPDRSVRSRIHYLGQMPANRIPEWRRKARVTIVASRFEVFGMVASEALAFGCPLVAARSGGLPEIVEHGANGLLFENEDAGDLAHQVAVLLDQPELAAKLGEQGAQDAVRRLGPVTIARQTKRYYEGVLADHQART